jgi:hypothetical protein
MPVRVYSLYDGNFLINICSSKAVQISMNLGAIEEWIGEMGLPRGVASHFAPVRALLVWLQVSLCLQFDVELLSMSVFSARRQLRSSRTSSQRYNL